MHMSIPGIRILNNQTLHPVRWISVPHGVESHNDPILDHRRSPNIFIKPNLFRKDKVPLVVDDGAGVDAFDAAIYGGFLFHHYGHFIAESLHRLWPVLEQTALKDLPVLFFASDKLAALPELPTYMRDVLTFLGIDPAQIHIVSRPTEVKTLYVPQQKRMLGGYVYDKAYVDLFRRFPARIDADLVPPSARNLYIGRSTYLHKGSYLGESWIEEQLAQAGIAVIKPEKHRFAELVALYRQADRMVFSEGTSLHVLESTGGIKGQVLVICRRHWPFAWSRFVWPLRHISRKISLFARRGRIDPLFDRLASNKNIKGCALVDLNRLLARLEGFYGIILRKLSDQELARVQLADLGRLFIDPAVRILMPPPDFVQRFIEIREQVNRQPFFEQHLTLTAQPRPPQVQSGRTFMLSDSFKASFYGQAFLEQLLREQGVAVEHVDTLTGKERPLGHLAVFSVSPREMARFFAGKAPAAMLVTHIPDDKLLAHASLNRLVQRKGTRVFNQIAKLPALYDLDPEGAREPMAVDLSRLAASLFDYFGLDTQILDGIDFERIVLADMAHWIFQKQHSPAAEPRQFVQRIRRRRQYLNAIGLFKRLVLSPQPADSVASSPTLEAATDSGH